VVVPRAEKLFTPPGYQVKVLFVSDLAVIRLNRAVKFNNFIRPIYLTPEFAWLNDDDIDSVSSPETVNKTCGWGQTSSEP